MINKTVSTVSEALEGVQNGMSLMLGGFGLCGIPEKAIAELVRLQVTDLTCISNNAGAIRITGYFPVRVVYMYF